MNYESFCKYILITLMARRYIEKMRFTRNFVYKTPIFLVYFYSLKGLRQYTE